MSGLTLRPERDGEEPVVRAVVARAFAHQPVVPDLVDALRASPAWVPGLSFLAELGGELVGHVLTIRSLLDAPRSLVDVLVISPLGVVPEYQGQGVGSALMRHCLASLTGRPEPLVFLEGSPTFYVRFGFRPAGAQGFRRPSLRIPEPGFMVYLQPGYREWMSGTLVYPDPFWRLDCVGVRDNAGAAPKRPQVTSEAPKMRAILQRGDV
ncbi:MAG: N-acetyltransferase [Actinomycetota bacterium]|nr:N-acetyltransferase [Actinomycetota bacterium]